MKAALLFIPLLALPGAARALPPGNLMPALSCAGATITATGVGYLPHFHCFTARASTGTYFDSSGVLQVAAAGSPRPDYHPVSHVLSGILVEKASMNEIRNSTAFNNVSYWVPNQAPVFGTTTAPSGASAVTMSKSNTTSHVGIYGYAGGTGSTTYTFSGFVKRISGTADVKVGPDNLGGANDAVISFNPGTGALISQGPGASNVSVTDVGNGWFRWSVTGTTSAGVTNVSFVHYLMTAPGEVAFWGAQREPGSAVTSYIPTTNGTVVRAADSYQAP